MSKEKAMQSGHHALIADLKALLAEAEDFEFDDYQNKKYAFPKMELHERLIALASNVRDGKYDQ